VTVNTDIGTIFDIDTISNLNTAKSILWKTKMQLLLLFFSHALLNIFS
jgi:hypothetical protein